jgi:hypothetical protein
MAVLPCPPTNKAARSKACTATSSSQVCFYSAAARLLQRRRPCLAIPTEKPVGFSRSRPLFWPNLSSHLAAAETGSAPSNVKSVWCLANVRCTSTTEPWTCGRQQAKEGSVNKPRTTRRPEQYTLHSQVATCGYIYSLADTDNKNHQILTVRRPYVYHKARNTCITAVSAPCPCFPYFPSKSPFA